MSVKHILFDLDGTLLPMNQEQFVSFYMPLLAKAYIARGIQLDPKEFIGKVWQGYKAMVKNDGSRTNREAFWSHMEDALPISVKEAEEIALDFYGNGFNEAMKATMPTEIADKVVKSAKKKDILYTWRQIRCFRSVPLSIGSDGLDSKKRILKRLRPMKTTGTVNRMSGTLKSCWIDMS